MGVQDKDFKVYLFDIQPKSMKEKKMKKLLSLLFIITAIAFAGTLRAEEVVVGLEPFPPFITEDGKGYTIDLLRAIEPVAGLKFNIKIMPYNRAKVSLKNGIVDLMGHTPFKNEVKEFYDYAQELNWAIDGKTDFYAVDKTKLEQPAKYKIGTPRGNKEFYSDMLKIPLEQFYEGDLSQLLKMLAAGREINVFIFERGSTMSTIKNLGLKNIFYTDTKLELPASLAVAKNKKGDLLKERIEKAIKQIDQNKIFQTHKYYLNLPASGVVQ